jgi:hypothetical protein
MWTSLPFVLQVLGLSVLGLRVLVAAILGADCWALRVAECAVWLASSGLAGFRALGGCCIRPSRDGDVGPRLGSLGTMDLECGVMAPR